LRQITTIKQRETKETLFQGFNMF